MMQRLTVEVRVGAMIFLAVVILVSGMLWLGEYRLGREGYHLGVLFNNVTGVRKGGEVYIAGVRVGKIKDIELQNGRVLVYVWIQEGVRLAEDSKAYVQTMSVLGEKYISIRPGTSSIILKDGGVIYGEVESDLAQLTATAGVLGEDLKVIFGRLRSALEEGGEENIKGSLTSLRHLTNEMSRMVERDSEEIGKILRDVKRFSSQMGDISETEAGRIRDLIASLDRSSKSLQIASEELTTSTTSLKEILQRLERGEGTLGRLVVDETLYDNLDKLIRDLDALALDVRKRPKRYVHISLF